MMREEQHGTIEPWRAGNQGIWQTKKHREGTLAKEGEDM